MRTRWPDPNLEKVKHADRHSLTSSLGWPARSALRIDPQLRPHAPCGLFSNGRNCNGQLIISPAGTPLAAVIPSLHTINEMLMLRIIGKEIDLEQSPILYSEPVSAAMLARRTGRFRSGEWWGDGDLINGRNPHNNPGMIVSHGDFKGNMSGLIRGVIVLLSRTTSTSCGTGVGMILLTAATSPTSLGSRRLVGRQGRL